MLRCGTRLTSDRLSMRRARSCASASCTTISSLRTRKLPAAKISMSCSGKRAARRRLVVSLEEALAHGIVSRALRLSAWWFGWSNRLCRIGTTGGVEVEDDLARRAPETAPTQESQKDNRRLKTCRGCAGGPPTLQVGPSCEAAGSGSVVAGRNKESCDPGLLQCAERLRRLL